MFEAAAALRRHADDRKRGFSSVVGVVGDAGSPEVAGSAALRKAMRTGRKDKKDKGKQKKKQKKKKDKKKQTKKKKTTLKKDRWASSTDDDDDDDDVGSDDSSTSTSSISPASSQTHLSTAAATAASTGATTTSSSTLAAPAGRHTTKALSTTTSAALSAVDQRRAQSLALRQTSVWEGCRSVNNYEKLNHIQEGTYGVVFRAKCLQSGDTVALKQVKFNKMVANRMGFPSTALREINVLLRMNHPNIIQARFCVTTCLQLPRLDVAVITCSTLPFAYCDWCIRCFNAMLNEYSATKLFCLSKKVREMVVGSDTDKIFMVMEYMEHDLKMLMEAMGNIYFHQSEVKCLMAQLLSAIDYMHGL